MKNSNDTSCLTLTREKLFEQAAKIRTFEEGLLDLYADGYIRGTVHTCLGQELVPAVLAATLQADDFLFGTHRAHGYFLALTGDAESLAREILGKSEGCSNGLCGSQHLAGERILTNGVQGGMLPVAAGFAMESPGITVAVLGDGTLGEGVLYETLNIANYLELPVLFLLEDNGIAQSTATSITNRGNIEDRIQGFGIEYRSVLDSNFEDLKDAILESVHHVRDSRTPFFLHVKTKRLGPHSKGDDNRPKNLLRKLRSEDLLTQWVEKNELIYDQISAETSELFRKIKAEKPSEATIKNDKWIEKIGLIPRNFSHRFLPDSSFASQINNALDIFLKGETSFLGGEDIETVVGKGWAPYNGAFGVTRDLSTKYQNRVKNFPISEAALVGFGIGRALRGYPTAIEVMFADFLTLTVDSLRQQAAKLVSAFGEGYEVPLVVRTATGGSRGYGPTHSQHLESLFLGSPFITCVSISPFGLSPTLYRDLADSKFPALVFEDKDLYATSPITIVHPAYSTAHPPKLAQPITLTPKHHSAEATLVTYGSAANKVLDAISLLANDYEVFLDVLVYEVLNPVQVDLLQESVSRTRRCLLVENTLGSAGLIGPLMSGLTQSGPSTSVTWGQVSGKGEIGASLVSEKASQISVEEIVSAVLRITRRGD